MDTRRPPTYLAVRLATNVRARRNKLGISQEELARRCELHRTYVGAVERGERNVSLAVLEALAKGLDCEPPLLLT